MLTDKNELIVLLRGNLEVIKLNLMVAKELYDKNEISPIQYCVEKEYCNKWTDRYSQCIYLLQLP